MLPLELEIFLVLLGFFLVATIATRSIGAGMAATGILVCLVLIGAVVYHYTAFPPEDATPTPTLTIGPGYGWSCVPVNASNATGEVLCRPVTRGAGP